MTGYFNAKLIDEIISGKPPKRKVTNNNKHLQRGKSFTVANRTSINNKNELTSKEFIKERKKKYD